MLRRFGVAGGIVLAVIPWLPGVVGLFAGLFTQGVIYNGVGVAINQQASQWELKRGARMMGRLHATFFVGSVVSAFLSGLLAALGVGLPLHMAAMGLMSALLYRAAAASLEAGAAADAAPAAVPHAAGSCRELGLLVNSAGERTVRFAPAYTVTEAQLDEGLRLLEQALAG